MKKIIILIIFLMLAIDFAAPYESFSQSPKNKWREKAPYGDYCPGYKGDWYGAKQAVYTPEQAKLIVEEYFSDSDSTIGTIRERKWFFIVDILGKDNSLIDVVIVDKRTGRIRSIH
ncbi:MAG: hypothetical protein LLF28_04770 [Nitrospiraceae bacterium]|nr:hypothetical protein [Nitrospiraceae bacterium]